MYDCFDLITVINLKFHSLTLILSSNFDKESLLHLYLLLSILIVLRFPLNSILQQYEVVYGFCYWFIFTDFKFHWLKILIDLDNKSYLLPQYLLLWILIFLLFLLNHNMLHNEEGPNPKSVYHHQNVFHFCNLIPLIYFKLF